MDPNPDQTRVCLAEILVPQPPALQGAGPEVLDHDVGLGYEPPRQLLALGLAQVQRNGLLVTGDDRPPQRLALLAVPPPLAHRVALAGRLDLDDLGPKVRQ